MFSSFGKSLEKSSITFVSQISLDRDSHKNSGIGKSLLPVKKIRKISKKDMVLNNYCPNIEVNPETYEVIADGELITCEPAKKLPLAQRYFMY
jgi:urease subunit alpha